MHKEKGGKNGLSLRSANLRKKYESCQLNDTTRHMLCFRANLLKLETMT